MSTTDTPTSPQALARRAISRGLVSIIFDHVYVAPERTWDLDLAIDMASFIAANASDKAITPSERKDLARLVCDIRVLQGRAAPFAPDEEPKVRITVDPNSVTVQLLRELAAEGKLASGPVLKCRALMCRDQEATGGSCWHARAAQALRELKAGS